MSSSATRRATYDDVLRAPDDVIAEILDGELVISPRSMIAHAHAASALGMDVGSAFQRGRGGPGGWWILDEPELHLGDNVLVPDLAGWRQERMVSPPAEAFVSLAPDWVCEVLSPRTARIDRVRKMPLYGRASVGHLWFVDPLERLVEIYRRSGDQWLVVGTHSGTDRVRAEPFDAIELDLGALWLLE